MNIVLPEPGQTWHHVLYTYMAANTANICAAEMVAMLVAMLAVSDVMIVLVGLVN